MKLKKLKIKRKHVLYFIIFIILAFFFLNYSLIIPPDGSSYYHYTSILDGENSLSTWSITRGPSFPIILYIFKHLFGATSKGLLFGFYLFYYSLFILGFEILERFLKGKKRKKVCFLIYILFMIFNPLIFGYSHTLLTEAVMPLIILLCTVLCYKIGNLTLKENSRKIIVYSIIFTIILIFTWFLKQPYAAIILSCMGIASIFSGLKYSSIAMLFEKMMILIISVICLVCSIFIWNHVLKANGVNVKGTNSSGGFLAKGILDGLRPNYVEYDSKNKCNISYIKKMNLSINEQKKIKKLIKKDGNWCEKVRIYNLYNGNNVIKSYLIITENNDLSVMDSINFLLNRGIHNPGYVIDSYTKNYLATINLYDIIITNNSFDFKAGNHICFDCEHENTSLGTVIYNVVPNAWWQYYGTSKKQLKREDVVYMKQFEGVNDSFHNLNKVINCVLPFHLYVFKIVFLLALPLFITSTVLFLKNKKIDKYYFCSIIFGSSFLHVLFHATMGALIDRYAYVAFPTLLIGIILLIGSNDDDIMPKKNNGNNVFNNKIILIVPAYNEEKNILKTYNSIQKYNKKAKLKYDTIIINDGSTDNTENILKENNIPHIRLINNLGIGGAVQTGYKYAYENGYDIAVQFDGDGQHNVGYVGDIIKPIIDGKADFTIGSRFIDKTSSDFKSTVARQMGIRIISAFIKFISQTKIYDTTSGFRACNKDIIKEFANNYPTEYPEPVTTTELLKKNYIVSEIPVSMNERSGGHSSIKSLKNIYYMINVILSICMVGIRRYK